MITCCYCRVLILICVLCLAPLYLHAQAGSVPSAREFDGAPPNSGRNIARPKGSQEKSGQDLDVSHWQELKNQFGWEIRFPKNWQAWGHGSDTPDADTDDQPEINGPRNCMKSGVRCAGFQVIFPHYDYCERSPREFFFAGGDFGAKIFAQGEIRVGGSLGYEVVYLGESGPVRVIALKHDGMLLTITYNETDHDPNAIKSPSDWTLTPVFEKILSTFAFVPPTKTFPPCK